MTCSFPVEVGTTVEDGEQQGGREGLSTGNSAWKTELKGRGKTMGGGSRGGAAATGAWRSVQSGW